MVSTPTAMPRSAARPSSFCRSQAASTAGTMTAPAWTGPPSNVSSKSSPWIAVPLTSAAAAADSVRAWPIAVHGPSSSQPASDDLDVILIARGDGETDDVDQKLHAFLAAPPRAAARHPARRSFAPDARQWRFWATRRKPWSRLACDQSAHGMSPEIPVPSSVCSHRRNCAGRIDCAAQPGSEPCSHRRRLIGQGRFGR